ncbi:hypothetical protein [Streptomyces sp. NBC_01217]|uniref:hypothetical protein n=1 Tax=Streptomyces sp. NBC_01217 TaxID=2903779 RepID=UPI002E0F2DE4|nr:hypothetical protein OG507_40145 [Streptomyces sp. NBC_01217]
MINEPLYGDPCPLCSLPLRPEFRRTRPSGQQDHLALVWFDRYRCDGCEAARPQQFWDVMRALYES